MNDSNQPPQVTGVPLSPIDYPVTPLPAPAPVPSPSDGEVAETISEIFAKHNHAINMKYNDEKPKSFSYYWHTFKYWVSDRNPFNRYVHVNSADEYINMPWNGRSVYRFWYVEPFIVGSGTTARAFGGSKAERKKVDDFIIKNHTIQFYLRKWGLRLRWKCKAIHDWCSTTINPRQKWLTKQIPKSWSDKTWLIPTLNFAMVVDFIEGEEALNVTDWEASSEQADKFSKELMDCYNYIKVRRPDLEKRHENSYPEVENMTDDYLTDYAETNRLEVELNKEDTKYLTWIVVNRDFFWT